MGRTSCCRFSATIPKNVRKNQDTLPPHLPSEPFHEVDLFRRREASVATVTMGPFFDNRVDIIWRVPALEPLMNIGIRPSVIFFERNKNGLQVRRHVFVSSLQGWWTTKQNGRRKASSTKKKRKWRRRRCGFCDKRMTIGVVYYKTQMHSILKARKSFGETRCKVLNAIQRVRFTKSTQPHASIWDKKGPSLGKMQVKARHQRSPCAKKFENRSHEETEGEERCAQSKALDLAYFFQAQSERQGYILLACRKVGSTKCFSKRVGGGRVCGWFPCEYAYDQWARPELWVGDHEDIKESDDGIAANGEVRAKKESDDISQSIGLIRQCYASSRNSRSAFIGETLWWTWAPVSLEKRSESTSHPKWQDNWLQYLCTFCGSWNISEFFFNYAFIRLVTIFITGVNYLKKRFRIGTEMLKLQVWMKSFGMTRCMIRQKPKTK